MDSVLFKHHRSFHLVKINANSLLNLTSTQGQDNTSLAVSWVDLNMVLDQAPVLHAKQMGSQDLVNMTLQYKLAIKQTSACSMQTIEISDAKTHSSFI